MLDILYTTSLIKRQGGGGAKRWEREIKEQGTDDGSLFCVNRFIIRPS